MSYATKEQIDSLSATHEIPLKKDVIYDKSIEYISRNFGSGKHVLDMQDKPNGKIVGNISTPVNHGFHTATSKLVIFVKDGKYKIFLENIQQYGNGTPHDVIMLLERDFETVKEFFFKLDKEHFDFLNGKNSKSDF